MSNETLPLGVYLFNTDELENKSSGQRTVATASNINNLSDEYEAVLNFKTSNEYTSIVPGVPNYNFDNFSYEVLKEYIEAIKYNYDLSVSAYAPTINVLNYYSGGVYDPNNDRVYLIPNATGVLLANWHYINSSGTIVAYAHGLGANHASFSGVGYSGGCYFHEQKRIYMIYSGMSSGVQYAHYIDCTTVTAVAYDNELDSEDESFDTWFDHGGGVLSPANGKIYLVPYSCSNGTKWIYIDCFNTKMIAYAHSLGESTPATTNSYFDGCYSPTEKKIYFCPYGAADESNWHYINCVTGAVVVYAHGLGDDTPVNNAYKGAIYSIYQNRIYFIPAAQSSVASWHYINCFTGLANTYAHGLGSDTPVSNGYGLGAIFIPPINKIVLIPSNQMSETKWHTISCTDGTVEAYTHAFSDYNIAAMKTAFFSGIYIPSINKAIVLPLNTSSVNNYYSFNFGELNDIIPIPSKRLMASTLFNKLI